MTAKCSLNGAESWDLLLEAISASISKMIKGQSQR